MLDRLKEHFNEHAGTYGWAGLAGYVIGFDLLAPQTLSEAADRALERPVGKYMALGATVLIAAHVVNALDHYDIPDPIHMINQRLAR